MIAARTCLVQFPATWGFIAAHSSASSHLGITGPPTSSAQFSPLPPSPVKPSPPHSNPLPPAQFTPVKAQFVVAQSPAPAQLSAASSLLRSPLQPCAARHLQHRRPPPNLPSFNSQPYPFQLQPIPVPSPAPSNCQPRPCHQFHLRFPLPSHLSHSHQESSSPQCVPTP